MNRTVPLKLRGRRYTLGRKTWLMGVVNVTPDSFYDGGRYLDPARAVERGLELAAQGADILDIGGESTRPGSDGVDASEERRRVLPVLSSLRKQTGVFLSIDTTKSEVAQAALDEGADVINDISGGRFDEGLLPLASRYQAAVVLMHMKGTPKTMQRAPRYHNLLEEIRSFLSERVERALELGVDREALVVDPGIGFGKTVTDNLVLLNNLPVFSSLGLPVLVGPSRKSFIGSVLGGLPPEERLEGTLAAAVLAVARGAHLLRVHDVLAVKRAVTVAEAILDENPPLPPQEKEEERSYGR